MAASGKMFTPQMASIYEAVHGRGLDYPARALMITGIVAKLKKAPGNALLDVACGTGRLLEHLRGQFTVEGLDASKAMLAVARTRLPGVRLHHAEMASFRTARRYDVITCLGASLCYAQSARQLNATIRRMARRLNRGGIIIADAWLQPEQYESLANEGLRRIDIDEPDRKIAVLRRHERSGPHVVLEYHYMVGTASGVAYFSERHQVTMFRAAENLAAFERSRLQAVPIPDPDELFRGCAVYAAVKS